MIPAYLTLVAEYAADTALALCAMAAAALLVELALDLRDRRYRAKAAREEVAKDYLRTLRKP